MAMTDCDLGPEDREVHAAGMGNVVDEDLEVTSFGFARHHDDDDD